MQAGQARDPRTEEIMAQPSKFIAILAQACWNLPMKNASAKNYICEIFRSGVRFRCRWSTKLDCGYRIDLLVNEEVILELKAIEKILPVHEARSVTCG